MQNFEWQDHSKYNVSKVCFTIFMEKKANEFLELHHILRWKYRALHWSVL